MTLLEEIYWDISATLTIVGDGSDRSLCANQLRAIRNRLKPFLNKKFILDVESQAWNHTKQ